MKKRKCFKKTMAGISAIAMGTTALFPTVPVTAAEFSDEALEVAEPELNYDTVVGNDYVLYTVNCGTSDSSVIPNPESERMGLLQSKVEPGIRRGYRNRNVLGLQSCDGIFSGCGACR